MTIRTIPRRPQTSSSLWVGTRELVERGAILPIVSNFMLPRVLGCGASELAAEWAAEISSPLSDQDNHNLARVAQLRAVNAKTVRDARFEYHDFVKRFVLGRAQSDPDADHEYVRELVENDHKFDTATFSEIAHTLEYPEPDPRNDPLRLLAEMPLPIYLTTSPHMFLEYALRDTQSRTPETEIFYWDRSHRSIRSVFEREPTYSPSVARPLVYHLFGIDTYPESMVLSEDDYVTVLMRLAVIKREPKGGRYSASDEVDEKYDIPADLKTALTTKGLLLLGYELDEWAFRVVFRWITGYVGDSRKGGVAPRAFCVQVEPQVGPEETARNVALQEYLSKFFDRDDFSVYWGDLDKCVSDLWSRWHG